MMKKRFLSLFCAFALVAGLLPATALAEENAPTTLYVGSTTITAGYWTSSDGGTTWTNTKQSDPPSGDSYIHYNGQGTLELHNATIQGGSNTGSAPFGSGIYAPCSSNQSVALTIELIGTNTITGNYGIYVDAQQGETVGTNASLLIQNSSDNGILKVSGSSHGIYVKSGTGNASINIKNVAVTSSTNGNSAAGVYVMSSTHATSSPQLSLKVNGGSLTASGTVSSDGIWFYVGSSEATGATTSLTVSENAIVDARNGGISASRISVTLPTPTPTGNNSSGIVFDGSTGTVYGTVALQNELTIGLGETLTVPDGSSLNCNGKLTNNGTILASGGAVTGNLSGDTAVTTPSITAQPTGQTVTEGSAATFSVTASAGDSETLTYQWQQSTDSGSSWSNISDGAAAASYTTGTTTTDMSGNQYRCVVKSASGVGVISQAATLTVQAKPAPPQSQPVTGVTLDKTTLELYTGGSATLTATVEPSDATNKNLTWQSDNANVATVQNGTVTAVGVGETTIRVTTEEGNYTATCKVTVTQRSSGGSSTPSKTPSQQAADKIESAKDGATVEITLKSGKTTLDKEVFETLAGRDVTLEINLPGGVLWTINGQDIPADANLTDLDMGVLMGTSTIPVDVFNAITGEVSTIQLSLAHDGAFGFTLTLTAPLGKEYADLWANLYHYDAGALQFEAAARIAADGTVSLPFTHASEYAIIIDDRDRTPKAFPFADVAETDWYYDAVDYAYQNELMNGTSATTFAPNGTMTRAMLVTILHRQAGEPVVNYAMPFTDVTEGTWYTEAVRWAAAEGIVTGTSATTFAPDAPVTREQFATILYRYAQSEGQGFTGAWAFRLDFDDADEVSEYAYEAMCWMTMHGVIEGSGGSLNPQSSATRAEAATMLMRYLQL